MNIKDPCHDHKHGDASIWGELICHFPYAVYSACLGFVTVSLLGVSNTQLFLQGHSQVLDGVFHSFHYLHIIFATTGSLLTFSRFSSNLFKGVLLAVSSAVIFCSLSDIILPYLSGLAFGVDIHFHLCFVQEFKNVLPFLIVGILNGYVLNRNDVATKGLYARYSHFAHILISTMASLFYLISQGFFGWQQHIGQIFILLIISVVIPCTFADVIVPVIFARARNVDEKYQAPQDQEKLL